MPITPSHKAIAASYAELEQYRVLGAPHEQAVRREYFTGDV